MTRRTILGFVWWLLTAAAVAAQSYQGGIRGSISDADGVIAGVDVTLTNEQTNLSRSAVTNERGEYAFSAVEPGTYRLGARLSGYKSVDRTDIRIGTQSFILLDLTLEVGTIEEKVTVRGEAPLIDIGNASQGTVLDSVALQTLPSPGRAAFLMGVSVPTFVFSSNAVFSRQQDQSSTSRVSIGGGPVRSNDYTFDGVSITDIQNRVVANPSIEALDDVKVQVHTYDVEVGRTGGGVFNVTFKSGTNAFRGTAFFQTRPVWGTVNNYFAQKAFERCAASDSSCLAKNRKPDTVYYLPGAGFGGPIKRDRTFFWVTTEDYHDVLTRNISTTFPTAAERRGDFSALTNGTGAPVTIYDPLTHLPFPGNIIPANRIDPVAAAIANYFPLPQIDRDNGSANYTATALLIDRFQQQYTGKIEHKFSDTVTLTGFYLYNRTDEPCAAYFEPGLKGPNRFADPGDYLLRRRPQVLALNNTWVLNQRSVLTLRFGWTRFPDNATMTIGFDPATLQTDGKGFSKTFLDGVARTGVPKFPNGSITGYSDFGAIPPSTRTWSSWGTNGSYSSLVGAHTVKAGAVFRRIGVYSLSSGNSSGFFNFDKEFTSSSGTNNTSTTEGNGFASFLLGYPSGNAIRQSTMTLTTPLDVYTRYYGGFVQDDWRVNQRLTLNYGLRLEHEDGLRERNNAITVGFDPTVTNALSSITIPGSVDPTGGTATRSVRGGLLYAGVNGNHDYQGDPPMVKYAPRAGVVYSIDANTVLRGGYGLFWAPWSYPTPMSAANNYGQVGYTQNTVSPQTTVTPTVALTNPFPGGLVPPLGNSLGTLSGVGTSISFVDQHRTQQRVQQFSTDVQRELPGAMAVALRYIGARGDHLSLGGSSDAAININQLDPKYLALGSSVLNQMVANPFFGNAALTDTGLGTSPTVSRAQLLRPYPQFLNVLERQVSEGVSRYHALVVEWTKRSARGLSGRVSYTYSVLKDNQFSEINFFTNNGFGSSTNTAPPNNYNYLASMPPCTTTNYAACFNPLVDYTRGVLDAPHRMLLAPIWQLPSPTGKSRTASLLGGGWTAAAVVTLQSGFPIGVSQSDNLGLLGNSQRPNLVPGVVVGTAGSLADRLASADHSTSTWLNPSAFATAVGTWGNAPRLLSDVRSPRTINTDVSVSKSVTFSGGRATQVKLEVINLFNRVQTQGLASTSYGNAAFGQINTQIGFMRMTQLMLRFSW
jgi:hypothetical protein